MNRVRHWIRGTEFGPAVIVASGTIGLIAAILSGLSYSNQSKNIIWNTERAITCQEHDSYMVGKVTYSREIPHGTLTVLTKSSAQGERISVLTYQAKDGDTIRRITHTIYTSNGRKASLLGANYDSDEKTLEVDSFTEYRFTPRATRGYLGEEVNVTTNEGAYCSVIVKA